jgi:hypothetical protein
MESPAQNAASRPSPQWEYLGERLTDCSELLADGRYDEARGGRRSAYTGRYTVTGSHLDYVDDTGFTATGDIRDGVLHHEHLVLYREQRSL